MLLITCYRVRFVMQTKTDSLGRITLPAEIRRRLQIDENTALQIQLLSQRIVIEKAVPTCLLCHATDNLVRFAEYALCTNCIQKLAQAQPGDYLYPFAND